MRSRIAKVLMLMLICMLSVLNGLRACPLLGSSTTSPCSSQTPPNPPILYTNVVAQQQSATCSQSQPNSAPSGPLSNASNPTAASSSSCNTTTGSQCGTCDAPDSLPTLGDNVQIFSIPFNSGGLFAAHGHQSYISREMIYKYLPTDAPWGTRVMYTNQFDCNYLDKIRILGSGTISLTSYSSTSTLVPCPNTTVAL